MLRDMWQGEDGLYRRIGKIKATTLGYEDHGILTGWLHLDFGGTAQGAGGYSLADRGNPHVACGCWVAGVLRACGVEKWEDVAGRTVLALYDSDEWSAPIRGIAPMPTERGETFMFSELAEYAEV